jgi:hypothetical protein
MSGAVEGMLGRRKCVPDVSALYVGRTHRMVTQHDAGAKRCTAKAGGHRLLCAP